MASKVVSLRLKETEAAYLVHQARLMQRTQGETAALLLSEKLREAEFPLIEFRPTTSGREVFVRGTRLKVWQVVMHARCGSGAGQIAESLALPVEKIQAALDYYDAYAPEIDAILEEIEGTTYEKLRRKLPGLQLIRVSELGD